MTLHILIGFVFILKMFWTEQSYDRKSIRVHVNCTKHYPPKVQCNCWGEDQYVLTTPFVSSSQNLSKIFTLMQRCLLVPELTLRHFSEETIGSSVVSISGYNPQSFLSGTVKVMIHRATLLKKMPCVSSP